MLNPGAPIVWLHMAINHSRGRHLSKQRGVYNTNNQNLGVRFSRTELSEGPVLAALRCLGHRIEGQLGLPEAYDGWAETLMEYKAHISNV